VTAEKAFYELVFLGRPHFRERFLSLESRPPGKAPADSKAEQPVEVVNI
jgi:hypothetical protein